MNAQFTDVNAQILFFQGMETCVLRFMLSNMVTGNYSSSFIPPFLFRLCLRFTDMNAQIYFFLAHRIWMLGFFSGSRFTDLCFSGSQDMNAQIYFFHAHGLLILMLRCIISGYQDMHAQIYFVQHGDGKIFEFIHTAFFVPLMFTVY